jgi:hypothetical protein
MKENAGGLEAATQHPWGEPDVKPRGDRRHSIKHIKSQFDCHQSKVPDEPLIPAHSNASWRARRSRAGVSQLRDVDDILSLCTDRHGSPLYRHQMAALTHGL